MVPPNRRQSAAARLFVAAGDGLIAEIYARQIAKPLVRDRSCRGNQFVGRYRHTSQYPVTHGDTCPESTFLDAFGSDGLGCRLGSAR